MSLILEKTMCDYLHGLCTQLGIHVKPKSFQVEFLRKAVSGVDGFLRAPCGAGKSLLFQLLPYVLKHFRYYQVEYYRKSGTYKITLGFKRLIIPLL